MRITLIEQADEVFLVFGATRNIPTCKHGPMRSLVIIDSWREGAGSVCLDCLLEKLASGNYEHPTQTLAQMEWEWRKAEVKERATRHGWDASDAIHCAYQEFMKECEPFDFIIEKGE